eukprot:TRINITY_DN5300_c1_g2_i1.p1 TRINITY_DN5300_c1_g2~~TRINITY_DN5300_c1_g2_i1.p1  ORF type:complete len:211 (-),score=61.70 TRINITY_DN5300_c1_g2_i1:27-659(-)
MQFQFTKPEGSQAKGQSEKKRARMEGEDAPKDAESDIARRLERLEIMCTNHDTVIRELEAHLTKTFLMGADDPIGVKLLLKMKEYLDGRPQKGPHAWGPPRHCLLHVLVDTMIKEFQLDEESAFVKTHRTMKTAAEFDEVSASFCSVREIKDGRILLKIRPLDIAAMMWMEPLKKLAAHVESNEGEQRHDIAPAGPMIRAMRHTKGKKEK